MFCLGGAQEDVEDLEMEYQKEVLELDKKYQIKQQPLFAKRLEIITVRFLFGNLF